MVTKALSVTVFAKPRIVTDGRTDRQRYRISIAVDIVSVAKIVLFESSL